MKRIKDSIYWSFASQECSVVSTHFAARWPCFHRRGCGFSACGGQDTTGTTDTAKSAQKHLRAMRMRAAWASGLTLTRESVPLIGDSHICPDGWSQFSIPLLSRLDSHFPEKNVSMKHFRAIRPASAERLFISLQVGWSFCKHVHTCECACIYGQICWHVQKSVTDLFIC